MVTNNAIDVNYAQGTWTPQLAFGGLSTGITYSQQLGTYTRIGNIVFINVLLAVTNIGSATGAATVTGLPITSGAMVSNLFMVLINDPAGGSYTTGIIPAASTFINMYTIVASTGVAAQLTNGNFVNSNGIRIQGSYTL